MGLTPTLRPNQRPCMATMDTLATQPAILAMVAGMGLVSGSVMLRPTLRPCMATLAWLVMVVLTPLVTLLLPQSMDTLATHLAIPAMAADMVLESGSVKLRPTLRPNQRPCMATMATLGLLVMVALTQLAILVMADTVPASGSARLSLTPRPGMAIPATTATLAWDMVALTQLPVLPVQCMVTLTLDTDLDMVSGEPLELTKSMQTGIDTLCTKPIIFKYSHIYATVRVLHYVAKVSCFFLLLH